jgi:hypothetical protein
MKTYYSHSEGRKEKWKMHTSTAYGLPLPNPYKAFIEAPTRGSPVFPFPLTHIWLYLLFPTLALAGLYPHFSEGQTLDPSYVMYSDPNLTHFRPDD